MMKWMRSSMSYYLEKLQQIKKDDKQYEAYLTNDSTVVIAGPGSGKTTILTLKIMRLLNEKINKPRGLACVTFSREAAREFKQRLNKLGYVERTNVFLGTVHSFCISEVIGNFAHLYNNEIPLPLKIISDTNKKKLFRKVVEDLDLENMKLTFDEIDKERTLSIIGLSSIEIPTYDIAMKAAVEYEKRLKDSGYVDYTSIVKYSTQLIQEHEYVRNCLSAKFPWIVVDEYQDLGKPLHEMILALFINTDIKIFAVGDPDQSIYGFSGAIPDYLIELYKREDILPIELQTNYRSNQDIINGSEAVLNSQRNYRAATRHGENAEFVFITCEEDMYQQYEYCVSKIIPYYLGKGIPYNEIALLVSSNPEVRELSEHLNREGIPYYISKHSFDRSDFVKWLEACAAWVSDSSSESFSDMYHFWESINKLHNKFIDINSVSRTVAKKELYSVLTESKCEEGNLKNWLQFIIDELYIKQLLENSDIYPDEIENIEKLLETVSDERYVDFDLTKFSKLGKPENQVTISTRHSSKGLEFEVVIILGVEEGRFPNYRSISDKRKMEEEHRICFVCVSRAKKACVLVRSKFNNITKKNKEIWHKPTDESIFWTYLKAKFGDDINESTFESH